MTADLQRRLPDSLIDRAMHRLPPAVFALEGPRIGSALKTRRQTLPQAAEAFYLSLAREPVLGGTAQPERFVVHRYRDSTTVRVFSSVLGKLTPGDSLRFRRTYFTAETHELSLDGLGGEDVFEITSIGTGKPIPLILYGGPGRDQLHMKGNGRRLKVYDEASDLTAAAVSRHQLPKKKRRAYDSLNDD
jgi:hypothetical protein